MTCDCPCHGDGPCCTLLADDAVPFFAPPVLDVSMFADGRPEPSDAEHEEAASVRGLAPVIPIGFARTARLLGATKRRAR